MAAKKKSSRAKKNSLVDNINRRKKNGTSRPRSAKTVSSSSYRAMKEGWPEAKRSTKKRAAKKRAAKKQAAKKRARKR